MRTPLLRFVPVLFLLLCTVVVEGFAQNKLSRKQQKRALEDKRADRLFIEGQKFMMLEDFERAYFYLNKAREIKPNEPAINFKLAEILLRAGNTEEAMDFARSARAADPENKYYALMMAEAYSQTNQPLRAAEILEELMRDTDENDQYILDLASIYLSSGMFPEALKALDRAEDYYGIVEQLIVQKQRIYLRQNNLDAAIAEGQKLVDAFPGNADYVINLVEILFNNGRTEQALSVIDGALAQYTNQPELDLAAYAIFREQGNLAKAEPLLFKAMANPDLDAAVKAEAFEDIMREMRTEARETKLDSLETTLYALHPDSPEVLGVLGMRHMQRRQTAQALPFLKRSVMLQPEDEDLIFNLLSGLFEQPDDFAEIETYSSIAVDAFPERPDFWFFHGVALLAQKKGESAVEALEKSLELNAGQNSQLDLLLFGQLGDAYHQAGRKEEAFAHYEKALAKSPDDEHVLNNYAYFLSLEKRDLERAKNMSAKLVKKHPKNATYLDTHAWVLFQLEEYAEAKIFMERALAEEETPSGVMLEHYGDILYHLGQRNEAISFWKKAEGGDETSEQLSKKIRDRRYYE
ncbi:hypothetical protein A3SI_03053 [Nitritalea halalkaliphila LW7]|uniref:Uncharacterized protein n=1 Tax=Nitritalea halalkaliphila LW7 TaxID=1189621 RepID=I5C9J2_9BACT|nr:tetratricopeptide repeat protein [Nitritalea halalkaliphila]EIM78494.1 hypothetical protein A3SI_03053 [Nitritalea halalkaliphila LW7]